MSASIRQRLQRHPISVTAFFRHSLVLTYALPREILQPLLPPGLVLDSLGEVGFVAVAMVQTKALRPVGLPGVLGQDFFLCGYRVFVRFRTASGRVLRGLRILRSDTDRRLMMVFGNLLTHYQYRLAKVSVKAGDRGLEIEVATRDGSGDLHVIARLANPTVELPARSPFRDWHQARLFAGPLPFTFDYEPATHSIVVIESVRRNWRPVPVGVEVLQNTFFDHEPFRATEPILASAFHVENIVYRWKRGVVEPLPVAA